MDLSEKYSPDAYRRRVEKYKPLEDEGKVNWSYRIKDQEALDFIFQLVEKHNKKAPKYLLKLKKIIAINDVLYAKLSSKGGIVFTNHFFRHLNKEDFKKPEDWEIAYNYRWKKGEKLPTFAKLSVLKDRFASGNIEEQGEIEVVGDTSEEALLALQRLTGAKDFRREGKKIYAVV